MKRYLRAASSSDVFLAAMVVAIIALMVLPIPPQVLDIVIAANIAISVTMLMLSIYINSPLSLSTFPTLLLFTTLLRLSLNIASTRQILLNAHAGAIIDTFGKLVVGGSLVVGIVVFLIITIVQFVVVAKGSERVAEVGARFTLDAMPGKQMSIDAELRAGLIDKEEARLRRSTLERESQLYGAMDGAMKFVKGDAIAGLLIALVNILAGVTIGVLNKGMNVSTALTTYSILTVGDGLVSQIPSLFVSIASGIIITRVSKGQGAAKGDLGQDIATQIISQPKALLITAFVMASSLLVPGFPKLQFAGWAILAGLGGYYLMRSAKSVRDEISAPPIRRDSPSANQLINEENRNDLVIATPLCLRAPSALVDGLTQDGLRDLFKEVRAKLHSTLGVPFPGIYVKRDDGLDRGQYVITVNEIPVASNVIHLNCLLVRSDIGTLDALKIPIAHAVSGDPTISWVSAVYQDQLRQSDISHYDVNQILNSELTRALVSTASELIGVQESQQYIDSGSTSFPDLCAEVQRTVPIQRLADVLRRLVKENISIRNVRDILQTLLEWNAREKDIVLLVEHVRCALSRQISYAYAPKSVLRVITLTNSGEEAVRGAVRQTTSGNYVALSPEETQNFVTRIKQIIEDQKNRAMPIPALVVSMDIRRYVRSLIEYKLPDIPVLSYQELDRSINLDSVAAINVAP